MTPSFDLLKPNFTLIKDNYIPIIYLMVLPGLLSSLGMLMFSSAIQPNGTIDTQFTSREQLGALLAFTGLVWSLINFGPVAHFQLSARDGAKQRTLRDYYKHGLKFTLPLLGLSLVFGVALIIGLILFIVPGLIVLRRYFLSQYYLVDKQSTIKQALTQSATDSKPYSGAIWGIIGVLLLFQLSAVAVQVIPVLGLIVAELLAYATVFMAVLRYREIQPAKKSTKAKK